MTIFDLLCPQIREILSTIGIDTPTEPQKRAIPLILDKKNVLIVAPTGFGKTEAAMLPLFHRIITENLSSISVLYITPLRALNRDMLDRLKKICTNLGVSVDVRHGDTPPSARARQRVHPTDIMITTPETFQIMLSGRKLREILKNVECVVVDEIHELAMSERGAQLSIGLERLYELKGYKDFQRIGLSATVGTPEKIGKFLVGENRDVEIINVTISKSMKIEILYPYEEQFQEEKDKVERAILLCNHLIKKYGSTLLFVNTRYTAENLAAKYYNLNIPIGVHHSSLSKNIRIQMENEFRNKKLDALICTSSLELGIDVSPEFIIQYNSPRQVTRLVQRVGRSAHHVKGISKGSIIVNSLTDLVESCVIAKNALNNNLEKFEIRENALSVLANQIVAYVHQKGDTDIWHLYNLIKRAYPYRNLSEIEYLDVLTLLDRIRVIRLITNICKKSVNTFKYFYNNISMLPDEKTYRVIDIVSRTPIGEIDESFAVMCREPFVMRGMPWQPVEFKNDTIFVEPKMREGLIPSWIGEEIPVPFEIAQQVGMARKTRQLWYPVGDKLAKEFTNLIEKLDVIPDNTTISIERGGKFVIINACFGTKVNETLAQLLGGLITARIGESVNVHVDPYRIIIESRMEPEKVKEMLYTIDPDSVQILLECSLKNSVLFKKQFFYVAKKFGIIEKDVNLKSVNIPKLIEILHTTPVYKEAIARTLYEKLDVDKTSHVIRMIRDGKIDIRITGLSPIGLLDLESTMRTIIPKRADKSILHALKVRLLNENVILACMNCKSTRRFRVKDITEIKCLKCNSFLISVLLPYQENDLKILRSKNLTDDDKKTLKKLYKNANLVLYHGKKAILALVARGIGPDTAAKLLMKHYSEEEDFLRSILEAEINYVKTRGFWDF